ncbi:hypothetical protein D3C76_165430 [compost metagenome]
MNYTNSGKDITLQVLNKAALVATGDDMTAVTAGFQLGVFRIMQVIDDTFSFEDLCGDTYRPEANPEIPVTTLARQKRAFRARVNREGVYGAVMQCRNTPTGEWVDIESGWGFVGDDFIGSGYDIDYLACGDDWLRSKLDLNAIQSAVMALISVAK